MVFSPNLLYQGYAQLNSQESSREPASNKSFRPAPPKVSHNETVRAALRAMTTEEHASVLAPLKGRHRRRMAREIAKVTHERHLQALRSGLL